MRVLIVEDDEFIGESIQDYLEMQDIEVDYFNNPKIALKNLSLKYDILLLDVNMPDMNGYQFYEEIKEYLDIPVIFITAYSDMDNMEKAFNLGAADYIKKPFELKELELRIKRLLFKSTNFIDITSNYKFDLKTLKLFYKDQEVDLTHNEKLFLELLVKNISQTVDNDKIKDYIWEDEVSNNTVRTQVKKLRSKLNENFIKNVRGIGYKIEK